MPDKEVRSCPTCGKPGVALVMDHGNTGVVWCEKGHVSVFSAEFGSRQVFDFVTGEV